MSIIYSQFSEISGLIFIPVKPLGLKLTQVKEMIRLSWEDNSFNEDGFVIEKKIDNEWKISFFVPKNVNYFNDFGPFEFGNEYKYRVRAFSILQNQKYFFSVPSDEREITFYNYANLENNNELFSFSFDKDNYFYIDLNNIVKIEVEDYDENDVYDWFFDNQRISLINNNYYSYVIPMEIGESRISVKRISDKKIATLNMNIYLTENRKNPSYPKRIRANSVNNSMIDIFWKFDKNDETISHFDIYRIKWENSNSKNILVDYENLSLNRIISVPYDKEKQDYSFRDFGLLSGNKYVYTVVAINNLGLSSLYLGKEKFGYIENNRYVIVQIPKSNIDIDPPSAVLSPNSSRYFGVINNQKQSIVNSKWEIEDNNSESVLEFERLNSVSFRSSDKSFSEDTLKLTADGSSARSKIIILDVI
jgi:hypothetical protein